MIDCKVPKMDERNRSCYLADYRDFDMAIGSQFLKSYAYDVSSVLSDNNILVPGIAYYNEELRIIDDLKFFPGTPMFFAKLLEWAWETRRAYRDAYWQTDNDELEAALSICVDELDEFVLLVMRQA